MSTTLSANRKLHSSLRYFLVLARHGNVDSSAWHSFKDDIASEIRHEEDDILETALNALTNQRSCVVLAEWIQCVEDFKMLLSKHNRRKLLLTLHDSAFQDGLRKKRRRYPDSPSNASISTMLCKKKTREFSDTVRQSSVSEAFIKGRSSESGFYLLKTLHVSDHQPTLALDDIVVAGATLAVICNFKFDIPWMWQRAPALQTYQKIFIVHGEGPAEEEDWRQFLRREGSDTRVRFVRPATPPYGTVHSKVMVLCYPDTCRVCIHTANMIQVDWDYKTQGAYMRDFPMIRADDDTDVLPSLASKDSFKTELTRYFEHSFESGEARREVLQALNRYDFTSAGVELVASVPGIHRNSAKDLFGHARLRHLLGKECFLQKTEPSTAVCQFSSLGSIQEKWIDQEFHETLFSSNDSDESDPLRKVHSNRIRLVFPTVRQVLQSNEGAQAGLALPVRAKNLHRDHITRKLCKWECATDRREMAMPHIKTYLRYPDSRPDMPCWVFLGSFNLSVAAWGRMQGGTKSKAWDRLNVLSFELGVLFLPRLACKKSHTLPTAVKHGIQSPKREEACGEAGRHRESAAQDSSVSTSSGTEGLALPSLPFRVPPRFYRPEDVAWTIDLLV